MILFTHESAYKILLGEKTMTARCWLRPRAKVGSYHYAQLNRRAESRFARLRILSVEEWDGKSADRKFAEAEGFESSTAFLFSYWNLNDHKMQDENRKHYKIGFKVIDIFQPTPPITIEGQQFFNKDFIKYDIQQLYLPGTENFR